MVIGLVNRKGGVGKTTLTFNLAWCLATKYGKRVLLVDFDSQSNLTKILNIKNIEMNIFDMLTKKKVLVKNVIKNIDVLPSTTELAFFPRFIFGDKKASLTPTLVLKNILTQIKDQYDYVLIDCPPVMDIFTGNVLSCADRIIIPATTSDFAISAIDEINDFMKEIKEEINPKIELMGVVINQTSAHFKTTKLTIEGIEKRNIKVLGMISQSESVKQAEFEHKSIFEFAPKSVVCEQMNEVVKEILSINI